MYNERGQRFGDELTKAEIAAIVRLRTEGMTMRALACRYHVSTATISRALAKEKIAKPATRGGFGRRIGACEL